MRLEKKDHHQFNKSKLFLVKFRTCFFTPFSNFNDEKIKVELQQVNCNYQEESKLNSTINSTSGTHTEMV